MKHHVKGLVLGLAVFLVCIMPAYGASIVTTNYQMIAVPFAKGTPTTTGYLASQRYMVGPTPWVNALNPVTPQNVTSANVLPFQTSIVAQNDFEVLAAAFPASAGYSYKSGVLAPGSLTVQTYEAQGTSARVGAEFYVSYTAVNTATITDPTMNLHWIQIVSDNDNITNNPGYGNNELTVDNPFSPGGRSPYYDDGGAATSGTSPIAFYDFPGRTDTGDKISWEADLFLVTGPPAGTPGLITIYNGVEWGWNNYPAPVPLPSALLLFGPALAGIGLVRRRFKK
jgi:hypothetical protein